MASRWLIMKKSQKGLTLVEVLVSISVFTIIIFSLFSTLLAMRKVVARQEEYVKIEMVCQDINVYWQSDPQRFIDETGVVIKEFTIDSKQYVLTYYVDIEDYSSTKLRIRSIRSADGTEFLNKEIVFEYTGE